MNAQEQIDNAKNLSDLLELLKTLNTEDVRMDQLPVFGGQEPSQGSDRVWSWDDKNLIVGTCADDFEIVARNAD